jgi:HPt (histidine-containing phosphotransfer) domain-containing protein
VRALTQGWQTATHGVKGESPVLSLPALTTLVRRQEETLRAQQTELDYFAARLETLQQQQQSLLAYLGGLLEGFALEEDESEEDSGEAEEELNSTT